MKNTINKSEIFKAAWKYKKENNWTLSAALKVAWSEAKEGRNNGVDALASLVGGNFYSAYLLNGFHVTMFQYENDWYLFDADNSYIHTSM
ncbi:MAG: hypothetical protein GY870_07150, partial [archaeon]|nr:hypothetical protein [archaeon]